MGGREPFGPTFHPGNISTYVLAYTYAYTCISGAGSTRVRRRDLLLGAVLAALATAAAVAVPLGYGGVVNGA